MDRDGGGPVDIDMGTVMDIIVDSDTDIVTDIIMVCGQVTGQVTGQGRPQVMFIETGQMVFDPQEQLQ